jgi:sulfonate transport system substrate-binding protein
VPAAVLTLALFGCAAGPAAAPAAPVAPATPTAPAGQAQKELFTVRVNTQTQFNEIDVADKLGFFEEEGVKIEYVGLLPQGVTVFQLIEQDEVDLFAGHPPTIAQARLAGIKAKAVAPGMIDDPKYPHVQYLVQEDSPIKSLDEAIGHTVAISQTTFPCQDGYVKYYLKSRGFDPDQVEFVVIPQPQQEQVMFQGLVDITTSHPPFGGVALATGGARELTNSWEIFKSPGAGLSVRGFSEKFIEEHPDVVQGVVNALYKARVWTNANMAEAQAINAEYQGINPEDVSAFLYEGEKLINPAYINQWFEISETIGLWNKGDVLPEDIYTNAFVPEDID